MDVKLLLVLFCVIPIITIDCKRPTHTPQHVYKFSHEPIDVVFVCHPKDIRALDLAIEGIKKNGENIKRVIVVSSQKLTNLAEWFEETLYPFTKEDVALEMFNGIQAAAYNFCTDPKSRLGWIYQQLLKLYAPFVIPDISSNVLIVDADTIFLNPTTFMDSAGNPLFNVSNEFQPIYFQHAALLVPGFKKLFRNYSGIAHHMLFQKPVLEDLFAVIKSTHALEPWRALCKCIDLKHIYGSPLSEYEIYFNFIFARTKQAKVRLLTWSNIVFNHYEIERYKQNGYHYVCCHTWMS